MIFAIFVCFICLLLSVALGFALFYLYRFATYIIVIEEDLSDALEIFERSTETIEDILTNNKLIADSPEGRAMLNEILDDMKVCRASTVKVIDKFTKLSKQKYIQLIEDTQEENE
jgi:hypothetical protein